jgi:hypothetical protein
VETPLQNAATSLRANPIARLGIKIRMGLAEG